jgi:hypothetical protein
LVNCRALVVAAEVFDDPRMVYYFGECYSLLRIVDKHLQRDGGEEREEREERGGEGRGTRREGEEEERTRRGM